MVSEHAGRKERREVPRFVRPARLLLYALFFCTAVVTFTGLPSLEDAVRRGQQRPVALMVAPILLALSIAVFAAYRFALVRARRYHTGKAFVQVGLMLLGLSLLMPGSLERYQAAARRTPVDIARHLESGDPDARAMAAELARYRDRPVALSYVPRLVTLLGDPSPEVRRQAHASLVALAGSDEGGGGDEEDPEAAARWRAYWQGHGVGFHP